MLELPTSFAKIHPVFPAIHLVQVKPDVSEREVLPPAPIIVDNKKNYMIEKVLRREKRGRQNGYRVKWKG